MLVPFAGLALMLVTGPGCKDSPDKICDRFAKLMADKFDKQGKLVTKEDSKSFADDCAKDMEKLKKDDPKTYECNVNCINKSKDLDEVESCIKKNCPN